MKLPFLLWGLMDGLLSPQGQTLSSVLSGRTLLRSEAGAVVLLTYVHVPGEKLHFSFCFAKISNSRLGVLLLLEPIYLRLSYFPGF